MDGRSTHEATHDARDGQELGVPAWLVLAGLRALRFEGTLVRHIAERRHRALSPEEWLMKVREFCGESDGGDLGVILDGRPTNPPCLSRFGIHPPHDESPKPKVELPKVAGLPAFIAAIILKLDSGGTLLVHDEAGDTHRKLEDKEWLETIDKPCEHDLGGDLGVYLDGSSTQNRGLLRTLVMAVVTGAIGGLVGAITYRLMWG